MASKKQTTMAKMNRELKLREKRERKQEKKMISADERSAAREADMAPRTDTGDLPTP